MLNSRDGGHFFAARPDAAPSRSITSSCKQSRVGVHDDQMLGAPMQSRALHGQVEPVARRRR
jgi:hypothetical protein